MKFIRVLPVALSAIALAVFLAGCKSEETAAAPAPVAGLVVHVLILPGGDWKSSVTAG